MKPEDSSPIDAQAAPVEQFDEATPPVARPWLVPLFAAALALLTATLCVCVFSFAGPNASWLMRQAWTMLWCAWMECQFALLAIWLALGGGKKWVRALVAFVGGCLLLAASIFHVMVALGEYADMVYNFGFIAAGYAALVAAVALPLEWLRWNRELRITASRPPSGIAQRRGGQFTLTQSLLAITLICVALGVPARFGAFGWQLRYAIMVAVTMHAALWAVLGAGRLAVRLPIVLCVSLTVGVCLECFKIANYLTTNPDLNWTVIGALSDAYCFGIGAQNLSAIVLLVAVLGVLRGFGYRLQWVDRSEASRLPASAASRPETTGS
jgi:hypothetical protein